MIESTLGIIEKMRIEVYPYDTFKENEALKTIFVQINPEGYSTTQTVHYHDEAPQGATGKKPEFDKISGDEVSFEFMFDSSGVIPPAKFVAGKQEDLSPLESVVDSLQPAIMNPLGQTASIEKELEEFKSLLTGYHGDTHEPRYLRLIWGGYLLECRCTSITIAYKLFRRDGRPIRAVATCAFAGTQSYKLMQAKQNQQSPDVTHERILKLDDKFTIMARQIYNSDNYYVDVAKANNLLSFRNIPVGSKLNFHPLK